MKLLLRVKYYRNLQVRIYIFDEIKYASLKYFQNNNIKSYENKYEVYVEGPVALWDKA